MCKQQRRSALDGGLTPCTSGVRPLSCPAPPGLEPEPGCADSHTRCQCPHLLSSDRRYNPSQAVVERPQKLWTRQEMDLQTSLLDRDQGLSLLSSSSGYITLLLSSECSLVGTTTLPVCRVAFLNDCIPCVPRRRRHVLPALTVKTSWWPLRVT